MMAILTNYDDNNDGIDSNRVTACDTVIKKANKCVIEWDGGVGD